MSLHFMGGREAKPPLVSVPPEPSPASSSSATLWPLSSEAPHIANSNAAKHPAALRFPTNPDTKAFYRRFFPGTGPREWNDWRWQLRARIRTPSALERIFELSDDERIAAHGRQGSLPVSITPYYASLIDRENPDHPLRRTHVITCAESVLSPGEADDPLGEEHDTQVPGLVHRYPDRVLFLTTGTCSTYCRYCTRSRMVGQTGGEYSFSMSQWEKAIAYIEAHTEVRDVLLSGGDPLTIGDDKLDWLLTRLRAIKHVEFLRIGTKAPVVMPQRITRDLVRMLKKHHPLWMSIHVTHPLELTPEMHEATARLADAGIPLGSQTVLLKGINDTPETMLSLVRGLLRFRVKPYYLYQCDPIRGSAHFRTPVETGIKLISAIRGFTTGYATPMFVIDAPGGGGKILIAPDSVIGRDGDDLLLRNYEGKTYRYPDPHGTLGLKKAV